LGDPRPVVEKDEKIKEGDMGRLNKQLEMKRDPTRKILRKRKKRK